MRGKRQAGVMCLGGLVLLCCVAAGCSTVQKVPEAPVEVSGAGTTASQAWTEGMQAFEEGDYDRAIAVFDVLSEMPENGNLSRRALFALAATRLILAQTPDEFSEALVLWHCWGEQVPPGGEGEDPRMLSPFIERVALSGVQERMLPKAKKPSPPVRNPLQGNLVACKDLLQAREKEMDRMRARLEAREREIRRLRNQIESLEAIHLKFQERKQEVSPP